MKNIGMMIVLAALMFLSGAFTGYVYHGKAVDRGVIKQQDKEAKAVDEHETKKDEVKKDVRKAKDTAKKFEDVSGCLDRVNDKHYLDGLLNAHSKAQPDSD